jgi:diaminopimelate decarboxylase
MILNIIRQQGFGADVVSGGELLFALKAGFPPDKIVFAGVGKSHEEIELSLQKGIHSLNIESSAELDATSQIAQNLGIPATISFRLNPDIDAKTHAYISTGLQENKFGISAQEALQLYERASKNPFLRPKGIHVHIGSQITSLKPYLETVSFIHKFVKKLKAKDIDIEFVDLGGGIGIVYDYNFKEQRITTYLPDILPKYLDGFKSLNLKLIIELGRSIIGSAGILISKVLYRKQTPKKTFIIVDAAMNNLLRPSLYGAHHEINPLKLQNLDEEIVDIVGPVCETGDFLAKERKVQTLSEGDYIAISGAGAYGQVLSSNYNLRPRIAEYLVHNKAVDTICPAEKIEEIFTRFF